MACALRLELLQLHSFLFVFFPLRDLGESSKVMRVAEELLCCEVCLVRTVKRDTGVCVFENMWGSVVLIPELLC